MTHKLNIPKVNIIVTYALYNLIGKPKISFLPQNSLLYETKKINLSSFKNTHIPFTHSVSLAGIFRTVLQKKKHKVLLLLCMCTLSIHIALYQIKCKPIEISDRYLTFILTYESMRRA